ncbi:MAG: amidotransferase, partial [Verrucomicrobia bacterium]|nr:amidotransferase [Verrucomicrobiota bacterium]
MTPIRIRALLHVPFEGPGHFAQWAEDRGHRLSTTRLYAGDDIPRPEDYDWLLVMGGPMSVYDDAEHIWLGAEKTAIRDALDADKYVLGVCLGAQLIACVLGARVQANDDKEIGWFPVTKTSDGCAAPF